MSVLRFRSAIGPIPPLAPETRLMRLNGTENLPRKGFFRAV